MSSSSREMEDWLVHVKTIFNKELEKDIASNVCVFQVPKSLSSVKPEAYTPQIVGLGPYHHLQPQLTDMERVKLDVVKKLHKTTQYSCFDKLTSMLSKLDLYVRSCYHKFLPMDSVMLSWIMTVDALFLFHLLCHHSIDKKTLELPPHMQGLADLAGKKLAGDAILRDVMMLENQIPIFFLEKMLTVGCAPLQVTERKTIVEEILPGMLEGFCEALSPLKETRKCPRALKRAHLLDLLYGMVVGTDDEFKIDIPADIIKIEEGHTIEARGERRKTRRRKGNLETEMPKFQTISVTGMLQAVQDSDLPFLEVIKPHAQMLQGLIDIFSQGRSTPDPSGNEKAAAEQKALIPTASSLAKAGVQFRQTTSIQNISFNEETHTFHLPAIKLGVNSEVVIRNLVAYETMAISGPLEFARFVELMDGLINDPDDVKLLKKDGIITGHLKDNEVTHLFNGMSNSIEVKGDCTPAEAIKKVNEFYNAVPNIESQNMMERYVYGAWKVLVVVATVLFFLLMVLQTFCSAYGCSSLVNKTS